MLILKKATNIPTGVIITQVLSQVATLCRVHEGIFLRHNKGAQTLSVLGLFLKTYIWPQFCDFP